jgi:hypothetical protein
MLAIRLLITLKLLRQWRGAAFFGMLLTVGKPVNDVSTRRDVRRPWNRHVRGTQRGRPAFAQVMKIRVTRVDPVNQFRIVSISADRDDIDRHGDPKIGSKGLIHRQQPDLERVIELDAEDRCAIKVWFTVFVFADLHTGRVDGAFIGDSASAFAGFF